MSDNLISKAALAALSQAGGRGEDAALILAREVRCDPTLRSALLDTLLDDACAAAVNAAIRANRKQVWAPPRAEGGTQAERITRLAVENLLAFPLPGGQALGTATRADLGAAIAFYDAQARNMRVKARWLQLVQQSVPDGSRVDQVLDGARLRDLQTEAQRDA